MTIYEYRGITCFIESLPAGGFRVFTDSGNINFSHNILFLADAEPILRDVIDYWKEG